MVFSSHFFNPAVKQVLKFRASVFPFFVSPRHSEKDEIQSWGILNFLKEDTAQRSRRDFLVVDFPHKRSSYWRMPGLHGLCD